LLSAAGGHLQDRARRRAPRRLPRAGQHDRAAGADWGVGL